ncbi:hypothetical protein [Nonomuraea sp. NPDC052265]|uniref:hypothetical protein n=1 Tax=Nonomuraea sp. NPDC052265 TaxID=3364374 RepID=UPI0037CA869F
MINLLTRLRRQPDPEPEPVLKTAADYFADAEAAEAARLAAEERAKAEAAERAAARAAAEDTAKIAAIEHKAKIENERREARLADERARAAEAARQADLDAEAVKRAERGSTRRVTIATFGERFRRLAVNIVVNVGAGYGQAAYMFDHLAVPLPVAVMLAAALELVAVTTLDYGLTARKAGRPYKLKMAAAALLAGVVASLNYSHWSVTPQRQGLSVPMLLLSLLCPLLWAWYHAARDAETTPARDLAARAARGSKIAVREHGAVTGGSTEIAKFTGLQWLLWFPSTLAAKRAAIRYGLTDPEAAYRAAAQHAADKDAARHSKIDIKVKVIKEAEERAVAAERAVTEMRELLVAAQATLETTQRRELAAGASNLMPYLPTPDEVAAMTDDQEKRDSAEDAFRQALLDHTEIPGALLGTHYGMSHSWGRARARRVREVLVGQIDDEAEGDEQEGAAP